MWLVTLKTALLYGALWLFLFSIPVGHGKNLFNVMHYYVVDTPPVRWVVDQVQMGIHLTTQTAANKADEVVKQVDGQYTEGKKKLGLE